ncbi:MAG TPA: LTA synthase family protein, partial [Gemmatimonadales bacterium]|nr:LTA synthase family protein [Gemmatimonadales bacterium]
MLARFRFLALYLAYWLLLFACLRAIFLAAFASQAMALSLGTLLGTFANGLRLDLSAAAYLCLVPWLLLVLASLPRAGSRPLALILPCTAAAATLLVLLASADLGVFDGWGQHIDAGVLGYLPNPREAWASAGLEPRGLLLALWLSVSVLFVRLARRVLALRLRTLPPLDPPTAGALLLCAGALVIPARGGLQLIPVNQSSAYFSPQRFANQAALNVGWNFFDTWRRRLDRRHNPYLVMPMDSARALVARARERPPEHGDAARRPRLLATLHPNILLIVWESLTARAVERLGGLRGITPEFDSLAREGLLFRRFYASGDHTEKGVAALLSGAPSLPNASILRVPSKAASLPMLSQDLAAAGYHTAFYYGGELGFGNLRSFTLEGRFERVLGKRDFPRSSWSSKWGAHDDAVADRILNDLGRMQTPFFVTWLTLSSHEPFDVPGATRVLGRDAEARFLNSLAYTDQVVGSLLRRASAEPWWANTLAIVVADHSKLLERSDAGAAFKSAESWFHIPMLWTGGALAVQGESTALGGQTDLAPTVLRTLGLPGAERYRFGRDLFAGERAPFAFYGFEEGFGLVTERASLVWERTPARVTVWSGTP